MEVKTEPLKEILSELFSLLEAQETHSAAVLQFLRDQGIATDEKLAPYLEQAGKASNIKWLAARRRMEFLLTPIQKETADGNKQEEKGQQADKGADKDTAKDKAKQAEALAREPVRTPAKQNGPSKEEAADKPAPKDASTDTQKTAGPQRAANEQKSSEGSEHKSH
jgi:hypothetical protein